MSSAYPMEHKVDKSFPYVMSAHTDISKTFERARAAQQNRQGSEPEPFIPTATVGAMQKFGRALRTFGAPQMTSEFE